MENDLKSETTLQVFWRAGGVPAFITKMKPGDFSTWDEEQQVSFGEQGKSFEILLVVEMCDTIMRFYTWVQAQETFVSRCGGCDEEFRPTQKRFKTKFGECCGSCMAEAKGDAEFVEMAYGSD
jgi:hypothetical protein